MDDPAESWMTFQDCLSRINQWPKIMTEIVGSFKDILYLFILLENLNWMQGEAPEQVEGLHDAPIQENTRKIASQTL